MIREKEFEILLTDRDRLRVRFTRQRDTVVDVTVQLECEIEGSWVGCRRYDASGGVFHVHPRPWDNEDDPHVPVPVRDLAEGLNLATVDLKANWPRYRESLERAWKG